VNGTLFFRATSADYRKEQMWKSDGTPEGTVLVSQFAGAASGASLDVPLVATGGSVYFAAAPEDDPGNVELWKSDGTAAGTTRVRDVYPGATGSKPDSIARVGNRVYFAATDPDAGRELWTTDGTEAGTARVADVAPGAAGSAPKVVGGAGGRVYFAADDATHGAELWTSDGTPDGTTLVADVAPGARASTPLYATAAGAKLLFWADDGVHGIEPWVAPLAAPPPFVVGRHVFYNNSRFDGRDAGINHGDDLAVATDKEALLPGQEPSFDNVTSYARGINGVMFDVNTRFAVFDELRFSFKVGPGGPPSGWAAAPQPLEIVRRSDHLPLDLGRYEITWADGAIKNQWLQVTVEAVTGGVTSAIDVFYFGNLVGDAGSTGTTMRVDAADYSQTRAHLRTLADVDDPYDFNRDGRVDTLDLSLVRGSLFHSLPAPAPSPLTATAAPAALAPSTRQAPPRRTPWLASQGDLLA
jgi:ELWxxDGT repeat protein